MILISTKVVYNIKRDWKTSVKLTSLIKRLEMSFGINGPDNNIPAIQKSHHTNDGGAGNLGYFQQERNKKKEEKEEQDVFESSSDKKDEENFDNFDDIEEKLDSIGTKIKNFWLNLNKNKEEKNPEDE